MYVSDHSRRKTRCARQVPVKSVVIAFAAVLGLAFSTPANAVLMQYSVEGTFDTGSLAGLHYSEVFSFDDASRPAVLGSAPWTTPLLSFGLDVESLSKHWTLADWPLEHTFSQWVDSNGFLNSLAYLATSGPPGDPPAFVQYFDDGAPHSRSNDVKWYDWSVWNTIQTHSTDIDPLTTVTTIPEPSSLATLLVGLVGMIAFRRWRTGA